MKRKKIVIVFTVCCMLLVLSSLAFAQSEAPEQPQVSDKDQEWKVYLESEARIYYFSPASVQRLDNRRVRVWEKISGKNTKDGETDIVKSLIELDCSSSKYRVVASREFDISTGAEKPEVISENEPWQYFSHETILGILYDNVCYKHGEKIQKQQSVPVTVDPGKEKKNEDQKTKK